MTWRVYLIVCSMVYIIFYQKYHIYHTYPTIRYLCFIYNNINQHIENNIPFIHNEYLEIDKYVSRKILLKSHSNHIITILKNFNVLDTTNIPTTKEITIKKYINNYIDKNNDKYYFKSEDDYQFLKEINLYDKIINKFSKYAPTISYQSLSFWYGVKNTCTPFHYDTDHANLLYIIEGTKRIYMIHPKYNKFMKGNTEIQYGASWSECTISNILKNKNIKYETIILKKNQIFNIPRYWWHAVINLEQTMAVTYHYYTISSLLFNF